MGKITNKVFFFLIGGTASLLLFVSVVTIVSDQKNNEPQLPTAQKQAPVQTDTFSYTGKTGKNALTLLQEKTSIEQAKSGLVIMINKRKADDTKREFWAFYVNGEMSHVGPKEYQTKSTDKILWKIEKY